MPTDHSLLSLSVLVDKIVFIKTQDSWISCLCPEKISEALNRFKKQCSQFKNKVVQKGQQNPNSANHQQRKSVATSFTSWPL